MNDDRVVIVEHLYKKFCSNLKRSMIYGVQDVFREWLGVSAKRGSLRQFEFWALEDVNFEVKRGETVGIIGRNGAGKSSLLRLINGIYPPDKGRIEVHGKLAAMIALGAGFHPHLSGRENIFLNGTILGMSKKEIQSKLDAIIDFTEIGDFIDAPVASYSSGMYVRLGFAIATHSPIDILLADEVLAVGDLAFKAKSFDRIGELRKKGVSTLLVSHDMAQISIFCNRVLLMDNGKAIYFGDVDKGIELYLSDFLQSLESERLIEKPAMGNDDFIVHDVRFTPELSDGQIYMEKGQPLSLTIEYTATRDLPDVSVNITFELPIPTSNPFFQATNASFNKKINLDHGRGTLVTTVKNINLNNFKLYMNFSVWLDNHKTIALWWKRVPVFVVGDSLSSGFAFFDVEYEMHKSA